MRRRVAEDGIEWMAARVRGDLVEFGERPTSRAERARERRRLIAEMLRSGASYRRIQCVLGVSSRTIAAVARTISPPVEDAVR
jgi:DNA-binding NarL/FixJ family response regulator